MSHKTRSPQSSGAGRLVVIMATVLVAFGLLTYASNTLAPEHSHSAPASIFPTATKTPPPTATRLPTNTPYSCEGTPTPYPTYAGTPASADIVQRQVSHCFDDAHVALDGDKELINRGLYVRMGAREGQVVPVVQYVDGFVFRDVRVPRGAQIITATLRLMTWYQSGTPVIVDVAGELSARAVDFSAGNLWPNQRPQTNFRTRWTISAPVGGLAESPDLAGVVQEIVGQEGWRAGNDLALLIHPVVSARNFVDWQAFDFFPPNAAQLAIRYEVVPVTFTPTVTATPTPTATPTATSPASTATATATNTPMLGLTVRGQVQSADVPGSGVAGVLVQIYLGVAPWPSTGATTDAEGRYETDFIHIPGDEMITVKPALAGASFEPPLYYWRHYAGVETAVRDFIAIVGATSTPTTTPTATATAETVSTSTPTGTPRPEYELYLPLVLRQ